MKKLAATIATGLLMIFGFAARGGSATGPAITLIKAFDYPATGASTFPHGINNMGALVGAVVFPDGLTAGFERQSNGGFVELTDPDGDGTDTQAIGLNDSGEIDGFYKVGATQSIDGFTLQNGIYTHFDGAPLCPNGMPCTADLLGLNNSGIVSGGWVPSSAPETAFAVLNNVFTSISVPTAFGSAAEAISNNSKFVVGTWTDTDGLDHGFGYFPATNTVKRVDDPAFAQTVLLGVNNQGILVGRGIDAAGASHGFAEVGGRWLTYDFPGANNFTGLNKINDQGIATGNYLDSAGLSHGLLLKIGPSH